MGISIAEVYQAAANAYSQEDYTTAVQMFSSIVQHLPNDANTWNSLGVCLRALGKPERAIPCYRRAIALVDIESIYFKNLGNALKDCNRFEEAIAAHKRAIDLEPCADHIYTLGICLKRAGNYLGALECFDQAVFLDGSNSKYRWDRSLTNLAMGDYERGWKEYSCRWKINKMRPKNTDIPQLSAAKDLDGASVLISSEQGFGDTILAARFLPLLKTKGARIFLECQEELSDLMRTVEGVEGVFINGRVNSEAKKNFHYHSPIMDLPRYFVRTLKDIPPPVTLTPSYLAHQHVRGVFEPYQDVTKIGIVWSGNTEFPDNKNRSTTLDCFIKIAEIEKVQLFSLQKGQQQDELKKANVGNLVVDLGSILNTFDDTSAAIEHLDLVIMTDSSVAHLAGSLGKPVWNLLHFQPYWIYGSQGDTCSWYDSMRLFRQDTPGEWNAVFHKVWQTLQTPTWRSAGSQLDTRINRDDLQPLALA